MVPLRHCTGEERVKEGQGVGYVPGVGVVLLWSLVQGGGRNLLGWCLQAIC